MPIETQDTGNSGIARLRELAEVLPVLKEAAQMYEAILPVLQDAEPRVAPVSLTPEQARKKMEQGLPLLCDLNLDLDVDAVRELMLELAESVESAWKKKRSHGRFSWGRVLHEPDAAARSIRLVLEDNRLDVAELLPSIAAGERGPVTAAAQDLQLDPDLLWTLAQNALKPALREWCRQLTPVVRGIPWDKATCFICGAAATLAELQDNDQVKHLRCGSCGADWRLQRLRCAHCGNEDQKTLSCLYEESKREKMRVEACDKCRCYLKVISSSPPSPPGLLAVEDLATLHLDYIALERGYARQSVRQHV